VSDPDARLRAQVQAGRRDGLAAHLNEAIARRSGLEPAAAAASVVREVLVPSMREVRQRYAAAETVLPAVLRSAEVAWLALEHLEKLEPRLRDQPDARRGSVVVATLEGDVHHIGKALLVSLLEASGYTVFDLGAQVSIQTIADAAMLMRPDAIGLSALLVSTSQQMPACVRELDRRGMHVPVLVGGASINRAFGRRVGILPDGRLYEPGVFYCRDVFEGLEVLDELGHPNTARARIARNRAETEAEREHTAPAPIAATRQKARLESVGVPSPPYWGGRHLEPGLEDVWLHLDLNTLYRHHWGGFHAKGSDYQRLVREEFEPLLEELKQDALRDGWLEARIVMGYFPCEAEDDHLLVYHPTRPERVVRQLDFPRQPGGEALCLTDYFRSAESGERDVLVLQAVSGGSRAGAYVDELQRAGEYRRMLFVNGLASATAEALAEYTLQVARRELGLEPGRGLRFSWGYPACPDLLEQHKILSLLGAAAEIDLTLSESGNLEPEHSTAAMVVHHPVAKYFAI
jgi:5-methyltetrahydrofolate--homocysteine methyltransferase